ncbi:TTAGGG repeat binding factor [Friedmanniomyces endolithicus]|nr:TTAGGG repeat binding factor [Friedmanniomyces endolithicus]KAK0790791.1 TTAGGG repeat binding factor [Friedmanniomyces endolithicus]KAK0798542.1 TTAGGG repeat binding factor [Friedmanniomyces endolithicus]
MDGPFTDFTRMTKRRRIDDRQPVWEQGSPSLQQPHERGQHLSEAGMPYTGTTASAVYRESSNAPPLWSSGSYPEVASYSEPYFYQATAPSTCTPVWHPTDGGATGGTYNTTSTYNPGGDMRFFPPPTSEQPETFEVPATYPSVPQPEPTQYAYTEQHPRNDIAQSGSTFYLDDASMHLKLQSLTILDNLATQLIHTIAKASYHQIQDLMRGNETEESQAYITLKNLFDQTRKVYSRETPLIDAIAIQMFQPSQQELIRKANIATFVSSILGAHDVSFFHLNEYFMETFVPSGHRLLKWQGAIFLELKTQTYISAIMNSDGSPEAMLDELFPPDLDALILTRHPDAPSLSPSEQDFIDRCRARRKYLLPEPTTEDALQELPKKYQWNDFVREFASCISKNVDGIMNVPVRSHAGSGGTHADKRAANGAPNGQESQAGGLHTSGVPKIAPEASNGNGILNIPILTRQAIPTEKKATVASSTIRQSWTKPEEDALLAGLEKVNGPHWSQILALYGRGGSVSEVLKDRNQVQLKDKARNLKLGYLKMGKDVPVALRGVTGELRKRGGARARAALGLLDDELEGGTEVNGGDGEGEYVDPELGRRLEKRPSKKKKGGRR